MKKLHLLFAVLFLIISCSKTDIKSEETFVPDPTIISEYHELDFNGDIRLKYLFDDNGRIKELIDISNNNIKYKYDFDSNNKLINISKYNEAGNVLTNTDIIYNTEGKIINFGDRTFSYNPDMTNYVSHEDFQFLEGSNNFYIEDNTYYNSGEPKYDPEFDEYSEQEITFKYYLENSDGLITSWCDQYEVFINYENELLSASNWKASFRVYTNNNFSEEILRNGESENHFNHDSSINSLFQGKTNLIYLSPILNSYQIDILLSINNVIIQEPSSDDPEHDEYIYEFNDNDLPTSKTRQAFFQGNLESEYLYASYYYQGDVVPK